MRILISTASEINIHSNHQQPLTLKAGTLTPPPPSKASENKMAARQGCFCPGRGGGKRLREGSHLAWTPRVRESRVRAGVPDAGLAAASTAPGTRGSGNADLPPHTRSGPASARLLPPPPPPSAAEHRERPLLGGWGAAEEKRMGRASGHRGATMKGLRGLSQTQLERTHSPSAARS